MTFITVRLSDEENEILKKIKWDKRLTSKTQAISEILKQRIEEGKMPQWEFIVPENIDIKQLITNDERTGRLILDLTKLEMKCQT